uniref:Uncharacterized protein n=1 Tax=Arundo donax TaxID=35708 RepID=A0A0A9HEU7_ARUDO
MHFFIYYRIWSLKLFNCKLQLVSVGFGLTTIENGEIENDTESIMLYNFSFFLFVWRRPVLGLLWNAGIS